MVNFSRFEESENGLILEDGVFVILGTFKGKQWIPYGKFSSYSFELYIKNKDGGFVKMGSIRDEESLETILNLIEYGKFLPNNILQ